MRVIIFGATGKTGRLVLRTALDDGHEVTAFGRSVDKLDIADPRLGMFRGDVFEESAVAEAVDGHEAVIVCLGSVNLRDDKTVSQGTRNVVDAMVRHGVQRLVVVSTAGVGDSWKQLSLLPRLLFRTMLRKVIAGHRAQEETVRQSPLDWTVVRSAVLSDKPPTGAFTPTNTDKMKRISRGDLARFLVSQLEDGTYSRQAISITS